MPPDVDSVFAQFRLLDRAKQEDLLGKLSQTAQKVLLMRGLRTGSRYRFKAISQNLRIGRGQVTQLHRRAVEFLAQQMAG